MREKRAEKQNGGHAPGIKKIDRQNPRQAMSRQGQAIPMVPTWKWVHRPLGYKIDSDSDGAGKPHHGVCAWNHPHKATPFDC